jgi:predicted hotdog family 3-hydroxylacyl-ACP dehydratase
MKTDAENPEDRVSPAVARALDRAAIAALIPHAGAMCLLDRVIAWNATCIECSASSHRDANNPLAANGRLEAICGVEYASQAMAVHGGLRGGLSENCPPVAGYLASSRDVICSAERLDLLAGDLRITAELLVAEAARVIYRFAVTCDDKPVLSGRAAVVLDIGASP